MQVESTKKSPGTFPVTRFLGFAMTGTPSPHSTLGGSSGVMSETRLLDRESQKECPMPVVTGIGVASSQKPLTAYEVAWLARAIGSLVRLIRFAGATTTIIDNLPPSRPPPLPRPPSRGRAA